MKRSVARSEHSPIVQREIHVIRRFILLSVACGVIAFSAATASNASAQMPVPGMVGGAGAMGGPGAGYGNQQAFGQAWGGSASNVDWNRFYHYPYVYYPQNFWGQEYFKSSDSLYHRYPTEMRIPVYNKQWHNYYPSNRRFHRGHHFILDTF
ncbi:hypothetical protein Poly21_46320 [Allorhodopirellula heiligendammensis]|uniref:Nuclear calmodulin-binding protein n=1 Tax=Allorhodopirellula heiligendammensis TaxID=2714739 RepID=A0A5C6BHE3_9BACT|nr:hypothetical protein Poly21_46320 [Allorhodopirellula heiligendammensis]|tara:strand:+ start:203 stop:658 length:456 start_codon:yes stop_codon:yes gene_type:complete